MSTRPRRSAAQKANQLITDLADRDNNDRHHTMSSRSRRSVDGQGQAQPQRGVATASMSRTGGGPGSSLSAPHHMHLTVKVPSSKLRQATSGGGKDEIVAGRRNTRGGKKSYVVESDSDEEEEEEDDDDDDDADDAVDEEDEEEEDVIRVGNVRAVAPVDEDEDANGEDDDDEEMEELGDEDAEGEDDDDEMEVDAYGEVNDDDALGEDDDDEDALGEDDDDEDALGEEDADGDIDMDVAPPPPAPTIKITKPGVKPAAKGKTSSPAKKVSIKSKASAKSKPSANILNTDDDDELSELESDPDDINDTVKVGGEDDGEEDAEGEDDDMDAEGEEIEVADEDAPGGDDDDLGSDDETGSRAETPDVSRMTARQRAKHGDVVQEYMKLSDEVQAKKVFTAEELSMRRAEMARRRRNLSEKRNEEVKMETINKLLKKQAPKTNRRMALLNGDETPDEFPRANPVFIRYVSSQKGVVVAVPGEILEGPGGRVFGGPKGGISSGKMVEEVS